MTVDKLSFTYDAMKRNPGDRIRAEDWNMAMQAIANLGENSMSNGQGRLTLLTPAQTGTGAITGLNAIENNLLSGIEGSPVNGKGTFFLTELRVGDHITAAGQTRVVRHIDSDTKLYVDSGFFPPIESGFTFAHPALLIRDGHVGIGTSTPQGQLEVSGSSQAETRPALLVKDGNVGIGVSAPQGLLDVSMVNLATGAITGANTWSGYNVDNTIFNGSPVSGSETAFLTQLRVGDRITAYRQTRTITRIESDTQLYVDTPFNFPFPSPSAFTFTRPALLVKEGNVGIGVANATEKLEVDGAIKATKFIGDGSGLTGIQGAGGSQWVNKNDGTGIYYNAGSVTIGASNKGATLQILNKSQDASGDTLILGRTDGTHLRLGYHADYSWLQSGNGRPLAINALGGNVGIGTTDPGNYKLKVQSGDTYLDGALTVAGVTILNGAVNINRGTLQIDGNQQIKFTDADTPNKLQLSSRCSLGTVRDMLVYTADSYAWCASYNNKELLRLTGEGLIVKVTGKSSLAGVLGIGIDNPEASLHIKQDRPGNSAGLLLEAVDPIGNSMKKRLNIFYDGRGNFRFTRETGQGYYMTPDGNWNFESDRSLKENISPLSGILDKIMHLTPVSFRWQRSKIEGLGFVAQEVEQIFPELVSSVSIEDKTVKGLPYPLFGVLAIAALQELATKLEQRIQELSSTVTALANPR